MMNNKKIEVNIQTNNKCFSICGEDGIPMGSRQKSTYHIQTNNKCFSICGEDGIPMGSRQKSTYHHDGPLGTLT